MALIRANRSDDVPPDVELISREDALKHQWDIVYNWESFWEV